MRASLSSRWFSAVGALMLTACSSQGVAPGQTVAQVSSWPEVSISQAVKRPNHYFACYRGDGNPQCGLRIYQIMVESFVDGDPRAGTGIGYGPSHHKGDLQGVISSLDYIQQLGINAIWLTPIFESTPVAGQDNASDRLDSTGYFASNFFRIDPRFGTLEQARTLVDEAHRRGIAVLFDGVFGHYKSNLVASPSGKRPKDGVCRGSNGGTYSGPLMSCADYTAPETLAFFDEVARYWVKELKIDGWRADQAYQVPVSAWKQLRQAVAESSAQVSYLNPAGESVHPLGYMVGEIWDNEQIISRTGYSSDEAPGLHSAFDFPLRYRLVQTLAVEEEYGSSNRGGLPASTLAEGFNTWRGYPAHAMPNLMLGNHDLVRFGDLLQRGGVAEPEQEAYWLFHKAAFSFLTAYSGPITLYYGEEIGQELPGFADKVGSGCIEAGQCDDHVARSSAVIEGVAPEVGKPASQLNARQQDLKKYLSTLMALRAAHPALYDGSRAHIYDDNTLYLDLKAATLKSGGKEQILYLLNTRDEPKRLRLSAEVVKGAKAMRDLLTGERVMVNGDGEFILPAPGITGRFLLLEP